MELTSFNREDFEQLAAQNGFTYWRAREVMELLGYTEFKGFFQAINRAIGVCISLGLPVIDNFAQSPLQKEGKSLEDWKLSRFACYLTAMNCDPRKQQVAQAQAYFAAIAQAFEQYVSEQEKLQRYQDRQEISKYEKTLHSAASGADVGNFGRFHNAGYLGLYNMPIWKIRDLKDVPANRSPLDFMGSEELAANRFRITQTESILRRDKIKGQLAAEIVAEKAGRVVRDAIQKIGGTMPEKLPRQNDVKLIEKALKGSARDFKKIDKPRVIKPLKAKKLALPKPTGELF